MPPKNETAAAEAVETETAGTEVATTEPQADAASSTGSAVATEGVRARRAFMLKQFIPNPDWINKNVVAQGKGTKATVGRIFGIATGFEKRVNEVQGRMIESIAIKGVFQSESYLDGEVGEASMVFFPMAYAEKIAAVFESDASIKVIEVDCDIGLEATGKTIPYEWVVVAFREGEEMAVLKRIKSGRPRPTALLTNASGAAITDQSKG